jgi:hypothetical protein
MYVIVITDCGEISYKIFRKQEEAYKFADSYSRGENTSIFIAKIIEFL